MSAKCECEFTGTQIQCARHQCPKNGREVELCQQGEKYWEAWEECRMPMQACFGGVKVQPLDRPIRRGVQVVYDKENKTKKSVTVSPEEATKRRQAKQEELLRMESNGRPGTHLAELLAGLGIHASAGCQCKQIAKQMDVGGPDWCQENLEMLVDKIEVESKRRGTWLFSRRVARRLVRKAIKKARKEIG